TVLHGHGNVGYAAGNNLGADWLLRQGAQVIWVLNPDTRLTAGTLADAAGLRRAGDRVLGATARATPAGEVHPDLGTVDLWTGRSGRPGTDRAPGGRRLTYVAGHSLLATREAWLALRGFCEDYFLFFEEADLALRAAQLGIPTVAVGGLSVAHAGGAATGARRDLRAKSGTAYFHASRSCAIFFRRHYRGRLPVMVTARLGYAGKALVFGGPAAAGAVLAGTLAGLRVQMPAAGAG
ncbi:MAG: glycosyltransferase family 2 protein, partial [Micromonosporaceae bacterium]|nr:glycosyltransferase family 2 protein [Micromonosporaceae bacterium]